MTIYKSEILVKSSFPKNILAISYNVSVLGAVRAKNAPIFD